MICAGCDLGISSAKVVITENGAILAVEIVPYKSFPIKAATSAMERALNKAGLPQERIDSCVATGSGKKIVPFANQVIHHEPCLHRALKELNPEIRTVIDVGGDTLLVNKIGENGELLESAFIDKCTAGTGMFIEIMAKALEIPVNDLTHDFPISNNPFQITNTCVVFAESEVISRINEGHNKLDVFAGVIYAVAAKIAGNARRISLLPEVALTGGITKNVAIVKYLERELNLKFADLGGFDPQAVAAFGAALLASERQAK